MNNNRFFICSFILLVALLSHSVVMGKDINPAIDQYTAAAATNRDNSAGNTTKKGKATSLDDEFQKKMDQYIVNNKSALIYRIAQAYETQSAINTSEFTYSDLAAWEEYQQTKHTYFEYRNSLYAAGKFKYAYDAKIYTWQYVSSILIFCVVVLIILAGITFSAIQFWLSIRTKKQAEQTELSLAMSGLIVKSSTLGVVILTMSLAFFYLYIKYIYPIGIDPNGSVN